MVENLDIWILGQLLPIRMTERGWGKEIVMVFGVESGQVKGNVKTVLSDASLFSVKMFDI